MEAHLQKKYGKDIFFLTYTGAVLQNQDFDYMLAVKEFIIREEIKTIYIVNDTSCRFINGIIQRSKIGTFAAERIMEELYIENYYTDFHNKPLAEQQAKLALHNVTSQANELLNSLLGDCLTDLEIEIKGLVTTKELFKEVKIESKSKVYEF